MKKIILSISLLVVITGFCIFATWYTRSICDDTIALLEQSETEIGLGRYDEAYETVFSAQRLWNQHEDFLGLALRHTESDDVDILFPVLKNTCLQKDQSEFLYRNREMTAMLKHLYKAEYPCFYNIL